MRVLAALTLVVCTSASANLRAPRSLIHSPSTALYPPGETLTVHAETLTFVCAESCRVTAIYDVESKIDQTLSFEFILPVREKVTAKVGSADAAVVVADAEPLADADNKSDFSIRKARFGSSEETAPLFRARFDGKLTTGRSKIAVAYDQPLGGIERDYGYSGDGRFLKEFQYELWPLKEWKLAPGFAITVSLSMKRKPPALFTRWFGAAPTASCRGVSPAASPDGQPQVTKFPISPAQTGDRLEIGFSMRDGFPHRLQCFLGDEDLHP